jgi:hypothetical protein
MLRFGSANPPVSTQEPGFGIEWSRSTVDRLGEKKNYTGRHFLAETDLAITTGWSMNHGFYCIIFITTHSVAFA